MDARNHIPANPKLGKALRDSVPPKGCGVYSRGIRLTLMARGDFCNSSSSEMEYKMVDDEALICTCEMLIKKTLRTLKFYL